MNYINYLFLRFVIFLIGIMPFGMLHFFSGIVYVLIYKIAGYRVKVVRENLRRSFPEKSEKEIKEIEKNFYRHFSDIILESLKGFTMKPEDIIARHKMVNPELPLWYLDQGRALIGAPAHYNNWEWGSMSGGLQIDNCIPVALYQPIKNPYIDSYIKKSRSKYNTLLVPLKNTGKTFLENASKRAIFIMASDQHPSTLSISYWIEFLNQDTACLHGIEKYSRLHNLPVLYAEVRKLARSRYEYEFYVITDTPNELPDGEITRRYMKSLEQTILKAPQYWLWTHRRWKYKREKV